MIPASKIPPALDRAVPVTIDMPIKQPMIHAADDIGERGGFLMLSSPALSYEATAIPGRDKRGPPVSSQNRKESPVFGEERACPLRNRDDVYDHIKDALRGQCTVAPSSALVQVLGGLDGADLNCYIKQTFKARWRKETAMDETKEKILAAATRLFARRGLDGVTIREICREAGVNGALVNYHFGTKENLYGACMRRMFEAGGGPTVVALDRDVKDARSWKAAVRAWVHGFSDTMHDVRETTGFAAGAFRHEVVNPSALSGHILEAYGRPLFESLCRLLRMATRTEMEVRLWATAIWSQLSSYALVDPMWQEPFRPEGVTREAWGAAFADFICARVFRELKYRGAPA